MNKLPVINISDLVSGKTDITAIANQINKACREFGFFYITNHGIPLSLQQELEKVSAKFFELEEKQKMEISMEKGGRAWRGYFPVKGELTSGKPDLKEGMYFGEELNNNDSRVKDKLPMHGKNLFPNEFPEMKEVVLNYMNKLTELGHALMKGISISLGLNESYFNDNFTNNPLTLFRIFHYPPVNAKDESLWGVGEHTDYGVLTVLKQDRVGGLQVKSKGEWINAPYLDNTFVCNIGDMLDKLTGGYYVSTPHRVLNKTGKNRCSFPFFFDPNFNAKLNKIDLSHLDISDLEQVNRWDESNLHEFKGTYKDYILAKVGKVFPDLG